jgi:hypothetical protein
MKSTETLMSRPDFLIVGAMKSGTTTLAAQIVATEGGCS